MTKLSPVAAVLLNDRNLQIGNICFQWAHLESLLSLAIWSLLRVDNETDAILTGGTSIRPRVDLAVKLSIHLQAPKLATSTLKEVQTRLQKGLEDRRNRAVHGRRQLDANNPSIDHVEMLRGSKKGLHPQSNADLAKLGNDIADAASLLHQAMLETNVYHTPCTKPEKIRLPIMKASQPV